MLVLFLVKTNVLAWLLDPSFFLSKYYEAFNHWVIAICHNRRKFSPIYGIFFELIGKYRYCVLRSCCDFLCVQSHFSSDGSFSSSYVDPHWVAHVMKNWYLSFPNRRKSFPKLRCHFSTKSKIRGCHTPGNLETIKV